MGLSSVERDSHPHATSDGRLRERHGKPTLGEVVGGGHRPASICLEEYSMEFELGVDVEARGPSGHGGADPFRVLAPTEVMVPRLAEQDDAVAFREGHSASVLEALQHAQHAD